MVKIEIEEKDNVVRLSLTSNRGHEELDLMDAIGNAILTAAPKRGAYQGETMVIDILKPRDEFE